MSKKRRKPVPTVQPKKERGMVINMNQMNLAKARPDVSFRTGRHMTEKDRPRKKKWSLDDSDC